MRIKRNDRSVPRYTAVDTIDSEGITTKSWGASTTISADFQPLNNKAILEHYGIDPGSGWHAFADNASVIPLGSVVKLSEGNIECIGIEQWYSHVKCILRLSPVVLP